MLVGRIWCWFKNITCEMKSSTGRLLGRGLLVGRLVCWVLLRRGVGALVVVLVL